ncbi:receptor-like protein kinase HSL1, partial [Fagus crenata]
MKGLNEIKASLGWRVVYAWVGDDPDGDLPPLSSVTCSTQGDYRVVTELEVYAVSIIGPFPIVVTNLLDLTRLKAELLERKRQKKLRQKAKEQKHGEKDD